MPMTESGGWILDDSDLKPPYSVEIEKEEEHHEEGRIKTKEESSSNYDE